MRKWREREVFNSKLVACAADAEGLKVQGTVCVDTQKRRMHQWLE